MTVLRTALWSLATVFGFGTACTIAESDHYSSTMEQKSPHVAKSTDKALYLAGGCFWCLEAMFERLKGVNSVESGYAGGKKAGVTYEEVCSGNSGHAETVKVNYNPKEVSADDLLRIFFTVHDPTTLNRQGGDIGTQYRSAIFYTSAEERAEAEKIMHEIEKAKIWRSKIVTEIAPLKNWTAAEDYHQDYFENFESASPTKQSRMNAGYCKAVIEPKVLEFRQKYASKLKKGA